MKGDLWETAEVKRRNNHRTPEQRAWIVAAIFIGFGGTVIVAGALILNRVMGP